MTPPLRWDALGAGDGWDSTDPVLERLARARPGLDPARESAAAPVAIAMLERIVAPAPGRPARRTATRRTLLALALAVPGVAVVVLVAILVQAVIGPPTAGQAAVAAEVRRVAATSSRALAGSGATQITFDFDQGSAGEERGTATGIFAGQDFDLLWQFFGMAPPGGVATPSLQVENRSVAGQNYLDTRGPDGQVRWYHLTGPDRGPTATGQVLPDPRTLLAQVTPAAGFRLVETIPAAGGPVHHLRAVTPAAGPPLRSFTSGGPGVGTLVTGLDLWVDGHDVISRMDLTWTTVLTSPDPTAPAPPCATGVSARVDQLLDTAGCALAQSASSAVSIRFSDLGSRMTIGVPAGAVDQPG